MTVYSAKDLTPPERLKRASEFLELGERDLQLIRQTSGIVRSRADHIVGRLYDRLASFPESAELLTQASSVTGEGLERRRDALTNWLGNVVKLVEEGSDWLPEALHTTGATHAGAGKSEVRVPIDLMVLTMALLEDTISAELLRARPGDLDAVWAWTKLLWVAFDVMAAAYDGPLPAGASAT